MGGVGSAARKIVELSKRRAELEVARMRRETAVEELMRVKRNALKQGELDQQLFRSAATHNKQHLQDLGKHAESAVDSAVKSLDDEHKALLRGQPGASQKEP